MIDYVSYCGPAIICKPKMVEKIFDDLSSFCIKCFFDEIKEKNIFEKKQSKKYCTECGNHLYDIKYKKICKNDTYEIIEKLQEKISIIEIKNDNHIYIGNIKHDDAPREFHYHLNYIEGNELIILNSTRIGQELGWFIQKYMKEINWLQNYYGIENVKLEFVFFNEIK